MKSVKAQVLKLVQAMPDNVTMDDVMAELYFKQKVEAGLTELDQGKGLPHKDVEKRMSRWLDTK